MGREAGRSIGGCCERRTAQPLKNTAGATVGTAAGDPAGWQWWVGREDGGGVGSGHAEAEEERGCLWELKGGPCSEGGTSGSSSGVVGGVMMPLLLYSCML